jgi:hypothetical protein
MFRTLVALIVLALPLSAQAGKEKRLSEGELMAYNALMPFMSEDEEKAYLKLKTQEERDAWLKANPPKPEENPLLLSYYDRYWNNSEVMREQIASGAVGPGWTYDQVIMAWGEPHVKRKLAGRPAERSEMYVYRFETDWNGGIHVWTPKSKLTSKAIELFQLDVYIDDGKVTNIERKDAWEN